MVSRSKQLNNEHSNFTDSSVDAAHEKSQRASRTVSAREKWVSFIAIFMAAYGADQLIKYLVQKNMALGESISVIAGVFRWHYILNPGAAFSIGENHTWVFTIIMAVAAIICLVCLLRARAFWWVFALSLLLGGIMGNFTDRLLREPGFGVGHVVDFISVGNFAIFNIADSCICVSMALIVLLVFRGINLDGTRDQTNEPSKEKIS